MNVWIPDLKRGLGLKEEGKAKNTASIQVLEREWKVIPMMID